MTNDSKPILTHAEVEAAIALFDDLNDRSLLVNADKHPAFCRWRENHGTAALRALCIDDAKAAEAIWLALTDDERDTLTWDFEFMPMINDLRDWGDDGQGSGALPDRDVAVAAVRAWIAENCPESTLKGFEIRPAADAVKAALIDVSLALAPILPAKCAAERADVDLASQALQEAIADGRAVRVRSDLLPGAEQLAVFESYVGRDDTIAGLRSMGFVASIVAPEEAPGAGDGRD